MPRACAEDSVMEPRTLDHRGVGKAQEEPAEEVRRSTGCGRGISGECCVQGAGEKMAPGLTGV